MKIKTLFLSFLAILFMAKMGYAQTADYLGQIKSSSDPLDVIYNRIDSLVATDTSSQNLRNVKEYLRFRNIWDKRLPGNTLGSRVEYANYVTQNAANPICNQTDLAAWQIMGPLTYESDNRQYNGLVKEVLCNPNDPNDIILGALESGIWKYRSVTNTWENVTDVLNLPGLSVSDLSGILFNPQTLLLQPGLNLLVRQCMEQVFFSRMITVKHGNYRPHFLRQHILI